MKIAFSAAGVALATIVTTVTAQACAVGSAQEIKGNWYCSAVDAISYTNFGSQGTYLRITSMENGICQSSPQQYNGPLAPMDGEVSLQTTGLIVFE